ncbi:MAG: DEAD/DEAH box helicase family protein [Flavobacteriales bacterium]
MIEKSPILNSPYEEPELHYATDQSGSLDYERIVESRRVFSTDTPTVPTRQKQTSAFDVNDFEAEYGTHVINLTRKEVGNWRKSGYPNVTRVTNDLLKYWFLNEDRDPTKQLFFAQREAIESAIWLNEVALKSNAGQNIMDKIHKSRWSISANPEEQLPRIAFKMATGTGKTVVMGALIVYHFLNRQEYPADTRFADYFLLVAPGITIRDRLGVLRVDTSSKIRTERNDYYAERSLIPPKYAMQMDGLNSNLVITNYHSFLQRTLQGNKKSPFDGKLAYSKEGELVKQEALEDWNQVIKRVLGDFKKGKRLLILNDEAHHCYLPQSKGRTSDTEGDENKKAAVWFTGLVEVAKRFKLTNVYDLSATPYYLSGSGYTPYSLFPWVVTDFGLIEAIESGLVKIPYIPQSDDSQEIDSAKLKHLYEHVKDDLSKMGRTTAKKKAKEEGKSYKEEPPKLPPLVKNAFDQFYNHYTEYDKNIRKKGEETTNLFTRPPVFIAVCNNTAVSKEVYKFIAGYEYEDEDGAKYVHKGAFDLFSNYDEYDRLKPKAPTLLIDSDALEDSDQVNDQFKKIFNSEIDEFKKDYARQYGQGAADRITDAELLREVVNTVGKEGKLGAHIRCVVSVSMLTEGWDANTVTHVAGLRAFGSDLLCEQVAGRALRRRSYFLQGYDKEGLPTNDKRKITKYKFPPEYAHIIGVPFKMFKGGSTTEVDPPDLTTVKALPDRIHHEITFPNVSGYRVDLPNDEITYDFSDLEHYEIDGAAQPMKTWMESAFSNTREELEVKTVLEKRDQELIFLITKDLMTAHFSDEDGKPKLQYFPVLKGIVEEWYHTRVRVLNRSEDKYKRLLYYEDQRKVSGHIFRGINTDKNTKEFIRPIFNHYNRFGSTKYVNGQTSKECFDTQKSHVNKVVMDSDWEAICAKTLEELDEVESYVKNQFLGFAIPYEKNGETHQYFTDFIAKVKTGENSYANLMIEITGMSRDKTEKKWYVENRWLPAVNAVREKYEMDEWHFIEVANDIRNIRSQLKDVILSIVKNQPIS